MPELHITILGLLNITRHQSCSILGNLGLVLLIHVNHLLAWTCLRCLYVDRLLVLDHLLPLWQHSDHFIAYLGRLLAALGLKSVILVYALMTFL